MFFDKISYRFGHFSAVFIYNRGNLSLIFAILKTKRADFIIFYDNLVKRLRNLNL